MLASFGNLTAAQMAELWARRTILGEEYTERSSRGIDMNGTFSEPETETLPGILQKYSASGWLAEGLVKLYAVEEVSRRYEGHFSHLEVGPATATHVRVKGRFRFGSAMGARAEEVNVDGSVPLDSNKR